MGTFSGTETRKCPSCRKEFYEVECNDYGGPVFMDCTCAQCGFELSTGTGSGIWDEEIYANRKDGIAWSEDELSRLILCQNPIAANNGAAPPIPLGN